MALIESLPEGAEVLDLAGHRAARAEARKTKSFLKLAAGFVEVRAEFPLEVAELLAAEEIRGALEGLVVDPADVDALFKDGLTANDLEEIARFITGGSTGE